MTRRLPLRTLGVLSCAALFAVALEAPAWSQISKPKNAKKALKQESQNTIKLTQNSLKSTKNVLAVKLSGFKKGVAGGAFSPGKLTDFFEDIELVQGDVADAVQDAVLHMRAFGSELLAGLADAEGGLQGLYPENFFRGDQGHLDNFLFNTREIGRKNQRLMRHRLRRLARSLRKNTEVNMTSVVGPGFALPALVIGDGQITPFSRILGVDLLMGFSSEDFTNDGVLCASGSVDWALGDPTVQVYDVTGQLVYGTTLGTTGQNTTQNRWMACFTDVTEGNYTVVVTQNGAQAHSEIGVR